MRYSNNNHLKVKKNDALRTRLGRLIISLVDSALPKNTTYCIVFRPFLLKSDLFTSLTIS